MSESKMTQHNEGMSHADLLVTMQRSVSYAYAHSTPAMREMRQALQAVEALVAENARLREALVDVADPFGMFKRQAEEAGCQINGGACISMMNDAETYKRIARAALAGAGHE